MSQIGLAAAAALIADHGGIDIFDQFVIRRAKVGIKSEMFRIANVNKGCLVKPQMANEPSNMVEHMAQLAGC